ncbi:MAG: hypothetical protein H6505_02670 [Calditrichaeota bacterium]|nr:hypothetical protein [Calditrichota bacterium]
MKTKQLLLFIICAWLWTNAAGADLVSYTTINGDFGYVTVTEVGDSLSLEQELVTAFDSLHQKQGILLDLRHLGTEKETYDSSLSHALARAYDSFNKPLVVLIAVPLNWQTSLGAWMKEKEWARFESSGEQDKAEAKLRTLSGRRIREGQQRMDWLMQNEKKQ